MAQWYKKFNIRKLCVWLHATDWFCYERNIYWDLFEINELLLGESFLTVPLFQDPVIICNYLNTMVIQRGEYD